VSVTPEQLKAATRRLRARPLDHGIWLEVAALLAVLGTADDAELAFATIGESARIGGQVALAVACGRHLAELGSVRGGELIDQVVDTYAEVKAQRAATAPPVPMAPAELPQAAMSSPAIAIPEDTDAIAEARAVIEQFGGWLAGRKVAQRPPAPLLSALSKGGARALIGVMSARPFAAGSKIIEVGEAASALYWIAHGTVTVSRADGTRLGELHSGAFFGEIALVGGMTRTARVTARDDSWVLEIPARAVETAAQKQPRLAEVLATHARQRLLANLMKSSELFRALGEPNRDALLEKFTTELVAEGTSIIHEGQPNQHLWVVVSGKCVVKSAGSQLAELGPGAAVGEISLVSGAPAVADVIAQERAVLLRLSKADFDAVAKQHPALLAEVEKLVIARETANRALFQDASDLIV
jgi:CRP-like cAMP-binding protein